MKTLWKPTTDDWTHVDYVHDGDVEGEMETLRQKNPECRYRVGVPKPSQYLTEGQLIAVNIVSIYRKAPMITAQVEQGEPQEVQAVYIFHQSDEVVLAQVNTATKHPEVILYQGGIGIVIAGGSKVLFHHLPMEHSVIFAHTDRHTIYVTIFNYQLLEKLTYGGDKKKTLYEHPELLPEP